MKSGLSLIVTILVACGGCAVTTACDGDQLTGVTFNPQTSQSLSQAQRRKYDVELFNQILVRGEPSEMIAEDHPSTEGRYQRFKRMAEAGYEPAFLALKLYDIRHGDLRRDDPEAIRRLLELAASGDATAKCLYVAYYWPRTPSEELNQRIDRFVREAAQAGVPACMSYLSALEKNDPQAELHWKIEAAIRGDLYAQSNLVWTYYRGWGVQKDIDRALCWLRESEKSGTNYARGNRWALVDQIKNIQPNEVFCSEVVTGKIR